MFDIMFQTAALQYFCNIFQLDSIIAMLVQ